MVNFSPSGEPYKLGITGREGKSTRMWGPIGSGWGREGGATEDHQISGWVYVGTVLLNTERSGSEQGGGKEQRR